MAKFDISKDGDKVKFSIRARMILMIAVTSAVLALVVGSYAVAQSKSALNEAADEEILEVAKQVSNALDEGIEGHFNFMDAIARSQQVVTSTASGDMEERVAARKWAYSTIDIRGVQDVAIAYANGDSIIRDMETVVNLSDRVWFQAAMKGQHYVTSPYEDSTREGCMVMLMSAPIYANADPTDEVIGVVYMVCDANFISNITNAVQVGAEGVASVFDASGTMIANQDETMVAAQYNLLNEAGEAAADNINYMLSNESGVQEAVRSTDGVETKNAFYTNPLTGWKIVVEVPTSQITGSSTRLANAIIMMAISILIVAIVCSAILVTSITKPIRKIAAELARISTGDFTKPVDAKLMKKGDETGVLARALEMMQNSLIKVVAKVLDEAQAVGECVEQQNDEIRRLRQEIESVSATTQELSASSEETAAYTSALNGQADKAKAAVEEITGSTQEGAAKANEISSRAKSLEKETVESQKNAQDVYKHSIATLTQAVEESKKVNEINELSNTILEITSQTNLLALNASIEAARAGEAGKGFAVVATEIGALADSSQESVSKIKDVAADVIGCVENLSDCAKDILKFIEETVQPDYDKFVGTAQQYNVDAEDINNVVGAVDNSASNMNEIIADILRSLEEVASATDEAATGNSHIAESTAEITNEAEHISEMAEETLASANNLRQAVSVFKIPGGDNIGVTAQPVEFEAEETEE